MAVRIARNSAIVDSLDMASPAFWPGFAVVVESVPCTLARASEPERSRSRPRRSVKFLCDTAISATASSERKRTSLGRGRAVGCCARVMKILSLASLHAELAENRRGLFLIREAVAGTCPATLSWRQECERRALAYCLAAANYAQCPSAKQSKPQLTGEPGVEFRPPACRRVDASAQFLSRQKA